MDLSHGGHLTHGSKPSFSGKNYSAFYYGVELMEESIMIKLWILQKFVNQNHCLWCKCICKRLILKI